VQAVAVPEDPSAEELRLTVTDMAERLIGDNLAAFRPILEDRPATEAGLALRVAFVSGSHGDPLVFALTLVSTGGGVALIQTSAAGDYLDETHSALHRDAIAALRVGS
jgi:DNA-binding transcriptional LysR family regulator